MKKINSLKLKRQLTLLLVEDNSMSAEATQKLLEGAGCLVDIAETGEEGYQKARLKSYDLILVDVGLPDMNGMQVARKIRKFESVLDRHTPILALTGHIESENKEKYIRAGINAVFSKPLMPNMVLNILNTFAVPSQFSSQKDSDFFITPSLEELQELSGEIINVAKSLELLPGKTPTFVKQMLQKLIDELPSDVELLESAYQKKDWVSIADIAHRLRGGTIYCGAFRLHTASVNLENVIQSGKKTLWSDQFNILMAEITNLQSASLDLLSS